MLSKLILTIRTLLQYCCVGVVMVVLGVPLMLLILLLPTKYRYTNRVLFRLFTLFYQAIVWCTWSSVRVIGSRSVFKAGPSIIIANHQSALDVPLLGAQLSGTPHVWFALAQFKRHIFLGPFVRRLGFGVDARDQNGSASGVRAGLRYATEYPGHVIVFPEGGRYTDGTIHPFMRGYLLLARHTQRPVIPVYMPFNYRVYPPGSFYVYSSPLIVVIGPAFVRTDDETDEEFDGRIRTWFAEMESTYARAE